MTIGRIPSVEGGIQPTLLTSTGDVIYASSASNPARLGIGSTGQVLTVAGGVPTWAAPATSGVSFTYRAVAAAGLYSIEYNGSNLYVAAGGNGLLSTSTDGITWTARTSGFGSNSINKVAYGNGLWVAVGDAGLITTSTDGITWTARTANFSTNNIKDVIYANSTWVAVGAGGGSTNTGGITYSTDGLTWTRKSQTLTVGTDYRSIIWNGTNFVIVTDITTNNFLYASTASGTWTAGVVSGSISLAKIMYDGTRSIIVNENGAPRFSTSATLATTTSYTGATLSGTYNYMYYYNSKIYLIGAYLVNFDTAPTVVGSQNHMINSVPVLIPLARMDTAGLLVSYASAIWVGATGYIICDQNGRIWTSF